MSELPQSERLLLAGAERRLGGMILLLIPVGTLLVGGLWGRATAIGFACGGGLAYLNYRWIVAVVDALLRGQRAQIPRRTYVKLFLPLALLAGLLYAIFSHSCLSPASVLAGLSLLVFSVLIEAVYQIFFTAGK